LSYREQKNHPIPAIPKHRSGTDILKPVMRSYRHLVQLVLGAQDSIKHEFSNVTGIRMPQLITPRNLIWVIYKNNIVLSISEAEKT